jgi:outer membrane protein OmpA-like peptidoglycan-associated protein
MPSYLRLPVVLATVLSLAGCGAATATPDSSTPAIGTTNPRVIGVLVSTAIAVGHDPAASLPATVAPRIAAAAGRVGAHVVVDRFGSGPGSSHVSYNAAVTASTGQNALIRRTQLQQAESELVRAIAGTPDTGMSEVVDVISGIRAMEAHLHGVAHGSTDVVIIGNALQTAPPISLAEPTQLADPATTLKAVVSRGLLPVCRGWRVYMIGGSLTADGGLDSIRDAQLREFWRQFFAQCGGRLVVWDTALTAFPVSGGEVSPASWTRSGTLIVPLPATLLFEPDRAILRAGAGRSLERLVGMLIRTYPAASAEVAGYTAVVPGPAAGALALSRARAQAVAAYLIARGVAPSRLSVMGYGDQDPVATNTTEAGRRLNRRVVITLNLHQGN